MAKATGGAGDAAETKEVTERRPGFNDKGEPYPGVDKDTGERKAVTLEGLRDEFGKKEGERIYFEIARIGQFGPTANDPTNNTPALAITGLSKDKREEVQKLLASGVKE
ncbi:MAG TPA: hypothetical protein VJS44_04635 [Pyrinomonadaceae bacterium]|nr:hypothetical protein [Pyrinomonadaceae bacterium]